LYVLKTCLFNVSTTQKKPKIMADHETMSDGMQKS
jgi:hypothetical protein